MKTAKIEFEQVELPITAKTIQELGNENGISMYIIRTFSTYEVYEGLDEFLKPKMKKAVNYSTDTLKIDKCASGWIGTINGHLYHDFRGKKIVEICKLEF